MTKPSDEKPLRDLVKQVLDSQLSTNTELKRLATTVYGDKEAEIVGLVGHNKKHIEYIENDKKLKWTISGIGLVLFTFKENLLKMFGL